MLEITCGILTFYDGVKITNNKQISFQLKENCNYLLREVQKKCFPQKSLDDLTMETNGYDNRKSLTLPFP